MFGREKKAVSSKDESKESKKVLEKQEEVFDDELPQEIPVPKKKFATPSEGVVEIGTIATSTEQAIINKSTGEVITVTEALVELINAVDSLEKTIRG